MQGVLNHTFVNNYDGFDCCLSTLRISSRRLGYSIVIGFSPTGWHFCPQLVNFILTIKQLSLSINIILYTTLDLIILITTGWLREALCLALKYSRLRKSKDGFLVTSMMYFLVTSHITLFVRNFIIYGLLLEFKSWSGNTLWSQNRDGKWQHDECLLQISRVLVISFACGFTLSCYHCQNSKSV